MGDALFGWMFRLKKKKMISVAGMVAMRRPERSVKVLRFILERVTSGRAMTGL